MGLFRKKDKLSIHPDFPLEQFEPVLRSSICTGELTACFRERASGKLREITVIRSPKDLADFAKEYGVDINKMRTVY